jgi:ferredoxin
MPLRKENIGVSGEFSVNDDCIGCVICAEIAPDNFRFDHEQGCVAIGKQPDTDTETCLCAEAKDICPTNAIELLDNESCSGDGFEL